MNPAGRTPPTVASAAVAATVRILLGLLFLYLGLGKALAPVEFLKLVRQYDLGQAPILLNLIAAGLPWFEVFCGLLLLSGVAVRGTALLLLAMLIPFTFVVFRQALLIQSAQGIPFCAVAFDCGCGAGEVLICAKMVENGILMVLAGWLLTRVEHRWCLQPRLVGN
jgi:uncharacterized membrane protein YphA (DoxX/SURF4 family)